MDTNLIYKILEECRNKDVTIVPHQMGDPFADERMIEILKKCKKIGLKVSLSTTAFLLNDEKIQDLMNIGIEQINISIDSTRKEVYESIRRSLDFEKVMSNINRIFELRNRKTKILISAVDLGFNKDVKTDFKSFWEKLADKVQIEAYVKYPDVNEPNLPRPKMNKMKNCYRLQDNMVILSDGQAAKCCIDYKGIDILGHVAKDTIENIWNGENRRLLLNHLQRHGRRGLKPCENCNL